MALSTFSTPFHILSTSFSKFVPPFLEKVINSHVYNTSREPCNMLIISFLGDNKKMIKNPEKQRSKC